MSDLISELQSHWSSQNDPEFPDDDKCCYLLGQRAIAEIERLNARIKDYQDACSQKQEIIDLGASILSDLQDQIHKLKCDVFDHVNLQGHK